MKEIDALHREQLWEGNVKLLFFSQSVEEAFSIFQGQQRGTFGKASSCGNLFEMSENLAVRSLCPMSGHFRVRS